MGALDKNDPKSIYNRWASDSDALAKELRERLIKRAKERSAKKKKTSK